MSLEHLLLSYLSKTTNPESTECPKSLDAITCAALKKTIKQVVTFASLIPVNFVLLLTLLLPEQIPRKAVLMPSGVNDTSTGRRQDDIVPGGEADAGSTMPKINSEKHLKYGRKDQAYEGV